ncbi:hypothetical protein C3729_07515 [Cloacibacterium normanense]|uniref:MORN repeat variant family protein n=1 Tax=Cloacibacterium normanense TaxID=237258 RepID=A0A2S7I5Q4_9FLAO|nr:hypothetical protein [Cloacibacterium normanense]PPZ91896.1 hypothetical protein C3729_07515 [Cloacibacterium normanense]
MSIISIITFVFMLKFSVYAQKADTTYYPAGQIKSVGVRNLESKKTGEWRTYFENGQVKSIIQYQNGTEHGKWITYFETGVISSQGQFTNGSKSGIWTNHYPSGKVKTRTNYQTGEIENFTE